MIDAEVYLSAIITRDVEAEELDDDVAIAPDIDVNQLEELPAILFTLTGDGQTSNADGLWTYILTLSFFAEGMDAAKALARVGYDVVHFWDERSDLTEIDVDGEPVWVAYVEDVDLPSRLASAQIAGRNVVQYTGSFNLGLRG